MTKQIQIRSAPFLMETSFRRDQELDRRLSLWRELQAAGGPDNVRPELIKRLRLHIGQQGIFRDLNYTRGINGETPFGVAVGVLHTGRVYSDDLTDYGLTYHYPDTVRGQRDANEIASLKACYQLNLPLFVIITPRPKSPFRDVRLGWVVDSDDQSGLLLIQFTENVPMLPDNADPPFNLFENRVLRRTVGKARPKQWRFRFDVLKRYGSNCAVCTISDPNLLEAAHLCPVEAGGCDDARNGLLFCLNHHRAFDCGLLRINPIDLSVAVPGRLGTTRTSIRHLRDLPHHDALNWAWERSLDQRLAS